MKVTLDRKGEYALRAAIYLAGEWVSEVPRKMREVTRATKIPVTYAPQILGMLCKGGIATARAGPSGGYLLARHPDSISVLEVLEAAEGRVPSASCILRDGPCRPRQFCALHSTWSQASEGFRARLERTSLAEAASNRPAA